MGQRLHSQAGWTWLASRSRRSPMHSARLVSNERWCGEMSIAIADLAKSLDRRIRGNLGSLGAIVSAEHTEVLKAAQALGTPQPQSQRSASRTTPLALRIRECDPEFESDIFVTRVSSRTLAVWILRSPNLSN